MLAQATVSYIIHALKEALSTLVSASEEITLVM